MVSYFIESLTGSIMERIFLFRFDILKISQKRKTNSNTEPDDFVSCIQNRFRAVVDNVVDTQTRIGIEVDPCIRPGDLGHYMYLDGKYVPTQVSLKFVSRWFGPFRVLATRGPVVHLDLPDTFGKMSPWVNVRCSRRMCLSRCWFLFTMLILVSLILGSLHQNGRQLDGSN